MIVFLFSSPLISSGEAKKSYHVSIPKTDANFLIVSNVEFFINPLRFCFLILNKSEKAGEIRLL